MAKRGELLQQTAQHNTNQHSTAQHSTAQVLQGLACTFVRLLLLEMLPHIAAGMHALSNWGTACTAVCSLIATNPLAPARRRSFAHLLQIIHCRKNYTGGFHSLLGLGCICVGPLLRLSKRP
jgi:hypothetical protein